MADTERRVRLDVMIDESARAKLARVAQQSGAPSAWHFRTALAAYLERFHDDGTKR